MSQCRRASLLVPLALVAAPYSTAQEVIVLAEDTCGACSIELTQDVLLGADGESVIGVAWDIQRLSDGRFVMAFQDVMYEFTVFSADGSEFRRVGREGEGPGEYAHVWWEREHGDGIRVFGLAGPLAEDGCGSSPGGGTLQVRPGSTEWVIEVLDLESGRVLASQVLDGWGQFFAPAGWPPTMKRDSRDIRCGRSSWSGWSSRTCGGADALR